MNNRLRMRAELFKAAVAGQFPTYGDMLKHLTPKIDQGWRQEWTRDLNQIAMEELSHGYPDITYILHRKDGYPSQILFRDATHPDEEQLKALRKGTDEIIALYCPPNTPNPYR